MTTHRFNHADDWTAAFAKHVADIKAITTHRDQDDDWQYRWAGHYIKEVQARFDDGETLLAADLVLRLRQTICSEWAPHWATDHGRHKWGLASVVDHLDEAYDLLAHLYAWEMAFVHADECAAEADRVKAAMDARVRQAAAHA